MVILATCLMYNLQTWNCFATKTHDKVNVTDQLHLPRWKRLFFSIWNLDSKLWVALSNFSLRVNRYFTFTSRFVCVLRCLKPSTLLKKSLWHRCFPVNFAKFLGTPFLKNTSGRLLLKRVNSQGLQLCSYFRVGNKIN